MRAADSHRMLLNVAVALFLISLALPAARSDSLSGGRATFGVELFIALPLIIVNPLAILAHPLIWGYVVLIYTPNVLLAFAPQLHRRALDGKLDIGFFKLIAIAFACGASIALGAPRLIGVPMERLLVGYYCWLLSIALLGVALAFARSIAETRQRGPEHSAAVG